MDLVNAALVQLATMARAEAGAAVPAARIPDPSINGLLPASMLRPLLDHTLRTAGPPALFELGRDLRHLSFSPLLHVLETAMSPGDLIERWRAVDGALGLRHRTILTEAGPRGIAVARTARSGAAPRAAENWLIGGLLVGLLQTIGCLGIALSARNASGRRIEFAVDEVAYFSGRDIVLDRWQLAWSAVAQTKPPPALRRLGIERTIDPTGTLRSLCSAIQADLSHRWRLSPLAEAMALSPRTLERRLGGFGHRLPEIVRALRVREACVLTQDRTRPLTEIAHHLGFADAAHFSRTFRQASGLAPERYRRIPLP